jgi:phosphatidate cytidylyltransferase
MKTRIITGVCAIALFIPICWFSQYIIFPLAISILTSVAVYEMAKCLGYNKTPVLTIPMYVFAFIVPLMRFFFIRQSHYLAFALVVLFAILVYSLAYVLLRKNQDNLSQIITMYAMFLYIVGCFASIVCLRYFDYGPTKGILDGKYLYLLVFIGAWVCDTFAYFTGRFFGKHKLIPEISPKKTIEGAIGGIVFTAVAFGIYVLILDKCFNYKLNPIALIILGIVVAVISQIGDLIASAIKRQYEIKDYGFIFPGHGGVRDRFDSVMLVAPVVYVFFVFVSLF